jgi:hypothetical protein
MKHYFIIKGKDPLTDDDYEKIMIVMPIGKTLK